MMKLSRVERILSKGLRKRWLWQWGAGFLVSGLCLWLLFKGLSLSELAAALGKADYLGIAAGFVLILATIGARLVRWQVLLSPQRYPVRRLAVALLLGQLLNTFLPARGGDVARALLLRGDPDGSTAHVLGTVAAEKVWDLAMLLASVLLLWAMMPLPSWLTDSVKALGIALGIGWGMILVLLVSRPRWLALAARALYSMHFPGRGRILRFANGIMDGLESLRRPGMALKAASWSVVIWGLGALVNLAVLWAFGIPSVRAALFLLVALMAGVSAPIPSAPGKLGIYEGITAGVLRLFGVPIADAVAVGLALHAVVLVPPILVVALLAVAEPGMIRAMAGGSIAGSTRAER